MLEEFKEKFIEDAIELLTKLEDDLMALEQDTNNQDAIAKVFRGMHTLKGTAGMYGFDDITGVTHRLESIFDMIRNGKAELDLELLNQTFLVVDLLRNRLKVEDCDESLLSQFEDVNRQIDVILKVKQLNNSTIAGESVFGQGTSSTSKKSIEKAYYILFYPDKDVFRRGINPLSIFDEFRDFSCIHTVIHNENEPIEKQIEDKNLISFWEIISYSDAEFATIEDVFLFFAESEYKILPIIDEKEIFKIQIKDYYKFINNKAHIIQSNSIEEQIDFIYTKKEELKIEFAKKQQEKVFDQFNFFYIYFHPGSNVFRRGVNPINIFDDFSKTGKFKSILRNEVVPISKQIESKEIISFWEILLVTNKDNDDLAEIFLFYSDDEYTYHKIHVPTLETHNEFLKTLEKVFENDKTLLSIASIASHIENIKDWFKDLLSEKINTQQVIIKISGFDKGNVEKSTPQLEKKNTSKKDNSADEKIKSIRVSSEKVDELMSLVSSLVILKAKFDLFAQESNNELFIKSVAMLDRLSKQFRDNALDLRLVPIEIMITRFRRLIRDLSIRLGKEVDFIVEGANIELDKTIINRLEDPVMHIIRNSLDHGIESPEIRKSNAKSPKGVIRFVAFYSGNQVFIQIQDDGAGINIERIREKAIEKGMINQTDIPKPKELYEFIFAPGFSTANSLTEVSGRGVGMDVVKKNIASIRGDIEIDSEAGLGTSVTIKLPLTLSILDCLTVVVNKSLFLLPLSYIESCIDFSKESENFNFGQVLFQGEFVPLISLREEFKMTENATDFIKTVIVLLNDKKYAIAVDQILGEHQAVVKPLGIFHSHQDIISGVSIFGDGRLAMILDVNRLIRNKKNQYGIV